MKVDAAEQRTFGEQIREYRLRAGLTQEQLAERAQLSPRGLVYLERDARRPQPSTARRLADALELTSQQRDELLGAASQPRIGNDLAEDTSPGDRRPAVNRRPGWRITATASLFALAAVLAFVVALRATGSGVGGSRRAQPVLFSTARAPVVLRAWGSTTGESASFVPPVNDLALQPDGDGYAVTYGGRFVTALRFSPDGRALGVWHVGLHSDGVGGANVDPQGNLWVTTGNGLLKFSPGGHLLGHWGIGFNAGQLDSPVAVGFAHNGNVVVGEFKSHRVQVVTPRMRQIVQWGGPGPNPQQFTPNGLVLDSHDDVYVMDVGNSQIEKYSLGGKLLAVWHPRGFGPIPKQSGSEWDLTIDRDGNLYAMESTPGSLAIEKLAPNGSVIARWSSLGPHGEVANNLAELQFGGGDYGFAATVDGRLLKVDRNLHVLAAWSLQDLRRPLFRSPTAIAADGAGHVYVAEPSAHQVVELATGSQRVTQWRASIASESPGPLISALAVDPRGDLAVLNGDETRVNTYQPTGHLLHSVRYAGSNDSVSHAYAALGIDRSGNVSILDNPLSFLRTFSPSGQLLHSWCASCEIAPSVNIPTAMAVSAEGDIYVAYLSNVMEFSPRGIQIHSWTPKGMPATGLAIDQHGNLYITGLLTGLGRTGLEVLSPSGHVLASWTGLGSHGPVSTDPSAVTVDPQGNIYLVDGQRVLELAPLKLGR